MDLDDTQQKTDHFSLLTFLAVNCSLRPLYIVSKSVFHTLYSVTKCNVYPLSVLFYAGMGSGYGRGYGGYGMGGGNGGYGILHEPNPVASAKSGVAGMP